MTDRKLITITYKGRNFMTYDDSVSLLFENTSILEKAYESSVDNGRPVIINFGNQVELTNLKQLTSNDLTLNASEVISIGDTVPLSALREGVDLSSKIDENQSKNFLWTKEQTVWLISCMSKLLDVLDTCTNKQTIWLEITSEFNQYFSTNVCQKQVYDKWFDLKSRHKDIKYIHFGLKKGPRLFEYEKQMDCVLTGNHDIMPEIMKKVNSSKDNGFCVTDINSMSECGASSSYSSTLQSGNENCSYIPENSTCEVVNENLSEDEPLSHDKVNQKKRKSDSEILISYLQERDEKFLALMERMVSSSESTNKLLERLINVSK